MSIHIRSTRAGRIVVALATSAGLLAMAGCAAGGAEDAEPTEGGELVIGAEQEPDCTDWIASCAGSVWGSYIMQSETIPSAFDTRLVDGAWTAVPSILLAGEPEVEVTDDGQQTITYAIEPEAVWSDGEPITSEDFRYTALQIRDDDDIFDRTGYDLITDVETPDEHTAVVTLSESYANWRLLFSGDYGVLPAHILDGEDRGEVMGSGYDFSGGPWMIEEWDRGVSVTLVPNEQYWGDQPLLDRVTFQFLSDTSSAFQALQSGQVDALYPSPQIDAMAQIEAGIPGVEVEVAPDSGNLEALWMNNQAAPLDSVAVRQAIAYALDREALVERVYGAIGVTEPTQSFVTPVAGDWGSDDFTQYTPDADRITELMEGDGWELDANGVWAKDGETASMTLHTLAGNARRDLMVQVIQSQLGDAGFDIEIVTASAAELFGSTVLPGEYELGLWTLVDTFPSLSISSTFQTSSMPSEENGYAGLNFARASVPELDELLSTISTTVDEDERYDASVDADAIIADQVLSLPIATVPNVLLWSDELGGDIAINPSEGPWWNLEAWGRVDG